MTANKPRAHIRIRRILGREVVHSVPVHNLGERYIDKVMRGLVRNTNLDLYFVDDSEVDEARERAASDDSE